MDFKVGRKYITRDKKGYVEIESINQEEYYPIYGKVIHKELILQSPDVHMCFNMNGTFTMLTGMERSFDLMWETDDDVTLDNVLEKAKVAEYKAKNDEIKNDIKPDMPPVGD